MSTQRFTLASVRIRITAPITMLDPTAISLSEQLTNTLKTAAVEAANEAREQADPDGTLDLQWAVDHN